MNVRVKTGLRDDPIHDFPGVDAFDIDLNSHLRVFLGKAEQQKTVAIFSEWAWVTEITDDMIGRA